MRVGDLEKQLAFDNDTQEGIHYSFTSNGKDVRLADIFAALRVHFEDEMSSTDKHMLRDMCIMIANGKNLDPADPTGKASILRFIVGFLIGRYFVKTDTNVRSERIRVNKGEEDDDDGTE